MDQSDKTDEEYQNLRTTLLEIDYFAHCGDPECPFKWSAESVQAGEFSIFRRLIEYTMYYYNSDVYCKYAEEEDVMTLGRSDHVFVKKLSELILEMPVRSLAEKDMAPSFKMLTTRFVIKHLLKNITITSAPPAIRLIRSSIYKKLRKQSCLLESTYYYPYCQPRLTCPLDDLTKSDIMDTPLSPLLCVQKLSSMPAEEIENIIAAVVE